MFPGRNYLQDPEWANLLILIEFFAAGLAAGAYFAYWLLGSFGTRSDRAVASRVAIFPLPLIALAGLLVIADLGQPLRALNMFITHSDAVPERGAPFFFNANSTMNWGAPSYIVFGFFALVAFVDGLLERGWFAQPLARNVVWGGIGSFVALVAAGYPGILLSVTQQSVWTDSLLTGALFMASGLFAGIGLAAIVAHWRDAPATAEGVRGVLLWLAIANAILVLVFLVALGPFFRAVAFGVTALEAVVFWVGVVAIGIVVPAWILWGRAVGPIRPLAWPAGRNIALAGALAIVGALAVRFTVLFSAVAALRG